MDYIEEHRDAFGVEPICTVLSSADVTIAPSTYYAARTRPPSARAVRDEEVTAEISKVHEENYGVYGVRKQLGRDGGVHARPVSHVSIPPISGGPRSAVRSKWADSVSNSGQIQVSRHQLARSRSRPEVSR